MRVLLLTWWHFHFSFRVCIVFILSVCYPCFKRTQQRRCCFVWIRKVFLFVAEVGERFLNLPSFLRLSPDCCFCSRFWKETQLTSSSSSCPLRLFDLLIIMTNFILFLPSLTIVFSHVQGHDCRENHVSRKVQVKNKTALGLVPKWYSMFL